MLVEVTDGQRLHVPKQFLAQPEERALRNAHHEHAVQVGAQGADQQDGTQFAEREEQGRVVGVGALRERHDVVVDEGSGEQRGCQRGETGHDDADHNHQQ